jgi:hypothetical protein
LTLSGSIVYRWPIAYVAVSPTASTITAGNVSDIRSFTSQDVGLWTTVGRPDTPRVGMFGFNTTLGLLEFHNGTTWGPITPTALDAGVITSGTISVARGGTGAASASAARTALGAQVAGSYQAAGSYAAASHGHSIADVTSLQASLDGKQAAGSYASGTHTHNALYGTGGANLVYNGAGAFTSNVSLSMSGDIGCEGQVYSGQAINSPGSRNTAVSGQALYISSGGIIGYGASTRTVKKNIVDAVIDVNKVLGVRVRNFIYDPKKVDSDGTVQIGVIAEELQALGLDAFVTLKEDGSPAGVAYEKLALALIPVLQSQAATLTAFEARLTALEK